MLLRFSYPNLRCNTTDSLIHTDSTNCPTGTGAVH